MTTRCAPSPTRLLFALLLAGMLAAAVVVPAPAAGAAAPTVGSADEPPELPDRTFEVVAQELMIEMDDGVRLGATVAFPSADGQTPLPGPFPVVLATTPYSRNGVCGCIPPAFFASRGMVAAIVDVRGTGGSEGDLSENFFSPREARDGALLIEYFGTQPYSTGKVGMAGGSYLGITQYLAAGRAPRHLAAIVPIVPISDLYRDGFAHGGIPNLLFDAQYIAVQGAPGTAGSNTDPALLQASVEAKLGQSLPGEIAFDYLARPTDDPFYRDRSPITTADRIEVPVLTIGGWRDGLLRGQTEMHARLARRPGVQTRLHMDPCTHKGCSAPFAPLTGPQAELSDGSTGRVDPAALLFEFLDHHLRGTPIPARPAVEVFVQGANTYVTADQWPPADVAAVPFRLVGDRLLGPHDAIPDGAPAEASYVTNPAAGFSNTFSSYGTVGITPFVPLDQQLEGPQGLTWRTGVLDEPLRLIGPIALELVASSTAGDTDWHAKLSDVGPDGTETLITEGSLRASHRALDPDQSTPLRPYHTHVEPTPIEPDTFLTYQVEIWPTAWELAPGHRLQLRLTSTDLPTHLPGWIEFDRDAPEQLQIHFHDPAENTVRYRDSVLRLPVAGAATPIPSAPDDPADTSSPPTDPGADRPLPETGSRTSTLLALVLLAAAGHLLAGRPPGRRTPDRRRRGVAHGT